LKADMLLEVQQKLTLSKKAMEDLSKEAKDQYTKKNEEQMLICYREVMESARRYAKAHDIELVMHYNDVPPENPDFYNPVNVSRKIQAGACIPMYIAPGIDITKEITAELNEKYKEEKDSEKLDRE
jgi:Skp family chaperone for outer membrane proteins